jgi:hypothetical protein
MANRWLSREPDGVSRGPSAGPGVRQETLMLDQVLAPRATAGLFSEPTVAGALDS